MSQVDGVQSTSGTVLPLSANDLEAVVALDTSLSGYSRRGFFEKRLKAALEHPKDYIYVGLHSKGNHVGFAMAKMVEGEFGKIGARASLDALGVDEQHQSLGAGRVLLDEVKRVLEHKGVRTLESQVEWSDRSLLGFFGDNGFKLAPRIILKRCTAKLSSYSDVQSDDEPVEIDFSAQESDDFVALSRDRILVRSMQESDLDAMIRIDQKLSGMNRSNYYQRKQMEALEESGVRVSVVAEQDGHVVGFIMARVDFGEFGHTMTTAVMDTMGVDPGYQGQGVGQAMMSQLVLNLSVLRVENLRTEVAWNDVGTIAFFHRAHFAPTQRMSLT